MRVDLFNEDKISLTNAFITAAIAACLSVGIQEQIKAEINADIILDAHDVTDAVIFLCISAAQNSSMTISRPT